MHVIHSLSIGGMERTLLSVVQRSHSRRVRHVICTMREPGPLAPELPSHVAVESLRIRGRNRLAALRLAGAIRRHRPDIVHARNWNTWLDATVATRLDTASSHQLVLGYHGLEHDDGFSVRQKRLARWLGLSAHRFTTVSHAGRDELVRSLDVPAHRIHILANGVDATEFTPPTDDARRAARMTLDAAPDDVVAVMVGALVPTKNHLTVLDALAHLHTTVRPLRLFIIGDGPLSDTIAQRAAQLSESVRVTLLGWRSDVAQLLDGADFLILASRREQMSNALLEAMSCGLTVIATDVGDSATVLDHGRCGVIVPPRDLPALIAAIDSVANNPAVRRKLGSAARTRVVDHFRTEDCVAGHVRFYSSLVQDSQRETRACAVSSA